MNFQVGDHVVHWPHGLGKIIQLEEKTLSGQSGLYYLVQIRDLLLWVPVSENGESKLRYPTPARDFPNLFSILKSIPEPLPDDRWERKTQLTNKIRDGNLEAVCEIIRDVTGYMKAKKVKKTMNDQDHLILERAQTILLNEWAASFSISASQAKMELNQLLDKGE